MLAFFFDNLGLVIDEVATEGTQEIIQKFKLVMGSDHAKRAIYYSLLQQGYYTNIIQIIDYTLFCLNFEKFPRKACYLLWPAMQGNYTEFEPNYLEQLNFLYFTSIIAFVPF